MDSNQDLPAVAGEILRKLEFTPLHQKVEVLVKALVGVYLKGYEKGKSLGWTDGYETARLDQQINDDP